MLLVLRRMGARGKRYNGNAGGKRLANRGWRVFVESRVYVDVKGDGCVYFLIKLKNSSRVFWRSLNTPSMQLVTVLAPGF